MQHNLFAVGTLMIGVAVGVLTVLSQSPVVAVIIPLLFSLVAGASGVFLAREDIVEANGRRRLRFVGLCVTALSVGLLAGLAATFAVQRSFAAEPFQAAVGDTGRQLTYQEQMFAAEVRAVARMLGADPGEQIGIVRAALKESSQSDLAGSGSPEPAAEEALVTALEEVAALEVPEPESDDQFATDLAAVEKFAEALLALKPGPEPSDVERAVWRQTVESMILSLRSLVGGDGVFPVTAILRLSDHPDTLTALVRLRALAKNWLAALDGDEASSGPRATLLPSDRRELIQLLQTGGGPTFARRDNQYFPQVADSFVTTDYFGG